MPSARLEQAYGLLHMRKGDVAPAHERLEAALACFRGLGAGKEAAQVKHLLEVLHVQGYDGRPAGVPNVVADG
jgi:hypothetical protein